MAAEGAEIKDEQIPPQEGGGDDEVRDLTIRIAAAQELCLAKLRRGHANAIPIPGRDCCDEATSRRNGV